MEPNLEAIKERSNTGSRRIENRKEGTGRKLKEEKTGKKKRKKRRR